MFTDKINALSKELVDTARRQGVRIALAESCTGGLAAASVCAVPGASDVFERGFVTYSNLAKHQMLDVADVLIAEHGAVSQAVAQAMARGALARSAADLAASITGVAGPGGGTAEKPVGLVHFAVARTDRPVLHHQARFGPLTRPKIQMAAVRTVLELLLETLS